MADWGCAHKLSWDCHPRYLWTPSLWHSRQDGYSLPLLQLCIWQLLSMWVVYNSQWPVRTGIGRTQPAVDGRHTCTVCALFQSVCVPFQSVLGQREHSLNVFPIRTETVRKRTEMVRKQCKYGVRLERARSVLCPCVWAIFPVIEMSPTYTPVPHLCSMISPLFWVHNWIHRVYIVPVLHMCLWQQCCLWVRIRVSLHSS